MRLRPPRSTLCPATTLFRSLAVDDLDGGQSVVRLAGKGGKQRIVPVGSYALRAVEDYLVRARPTLVAARRAGVRGGALFLNVRPEEHTSELQSRQYLVCRLL